MGGVQGYYSDLLQEVCDFCFSRTKELACPLKEIVSDSQKKMYIKNMNQQI